jgi:hypothetical protein
VRRGRGGALRQLLLQLHSLPRRRPLRPLWLLLTLLLLLLTLLLPVLLLLLLLLLLPVLPVPDSRQPPRPTWMGSFS